jgi:tRNA G18 (ribose-2'-O)-methylase SpoU
MLAPDEALDLLRGLRDHPEHPFREGLAVLEGQKILRQLMLAGGMPCAVVGTSDDASIVPTVACSEAELTSLIGFRPHSPLIGLVRIPDTVDPDHCVFPAIALEGISDAANVGAIVRTAVGMGIRTLITDNATSHPFLRRAVRTSMGACFHIDHVRVDSVPAFLRDLTAEGRITIAMEQCPQSIPCTEVVGGVDVLAIGNEGSGCSAALLAAVSRIVELPMATASMSLNVAAAAAIGMYALLQPDGNGRRHG